MRTQPWDGRRVGHAPHRWYFFHGMVVLMAALLWWFWTLVLQTQGTVAVLGFQARVVHASIMVLGFMPLFFAGFLFTAGPKWLGVREPERKRWMWPASVQALGWCLCLLSSATSERLMALGLLVVLLGWLGVYSVFAGLWQRSTADDRIHATGVLLAGAAGALCLLCMALALLLHRSDAVLPLTRLALWLCVTLTFVVVVHRMVPFFTSSALPMIRLWRPMWVLWFFCAHVLVQALDVLLGWLLPAMPALWIGVMMVWECIAALTILGLAVAWGLRQSLSIRLLAMLHIGFVWLGAANVLAAISRASLLMSGQPLLYWAALHALTTGFLGSLMLAMVTRVSCGHSGRPLVADRLAWGAFWIWQCAVALRILAEGAGAMQAPLWVAAAALCLLVALVWGGRLVLWYGLPRADGRAG